MTVAAASARIPLLKGLKELARRGATLEASVVTTYAFSGLFYEEVLLRAFQRAGSRLNVVLVDAGQLARCLDDPLRRPTRAGVDYLLAPVSVPGAFHSKIVALLGKDRSFLALGSHNATDAGFSHNEELTAFWDIGDAPPAAILSSAVDYAVGWLAASNAAPAPLLGEVARRLRDLTPGAPHGAIGGPTFIGCDGRVRLWDQIRSAIAGPVSRVRIVAPYFDSGLALLRTIHDQLGPTEILVGVEPDQVLLPSPERAPSSVRFVDVSGLPALAHAAGEPGFVHGKAVAFELTGGHVVTFGSANPTGAGWLAGPIWNAEANLLASGEQATAAFVALGLGGLDGAPILGERALRDIAARSRNQRRRDAEAAGSLVEPLLLGKVVEGGLLVPGLERFGSGEVVLHRPGGRMSSAALAPVDGRTFIRCDDDPFEGGIYGVQSDAQPSASVLLNDAQVFRAASMPREGTRILDRLGSLDVEDDFTELIEMLDKHLLGGADGGPSSSGGTSRAGSARAPSPDPDAPFGPRGVSLPLERDGGQARRRLSMGLVSDIIAALMQALAASPTPKVDGDAPDRDEEDADGPPGEGFASNGIDAPNSVEIDWPRLVVACRKRLGTMLGRLEARMIEAEAGVREAAWAVERLVIALLLLQRLRAMPPRGAISKRARPASLVGMEQMRRAFRIGVRALYGSGRLAESLEGAAPTRAAEERRLLDNVLFWLAREVGADCDPPPGARLHDRESLRDRADVVPVAMSASAYRRLEPWAEFRDGWLPMWDDAVRCGPDWCLRQVAFGRALRRLRERPLLSGTGPLSVGDYVRWSGEPGMPWVVAEVSGRKVHLFEPAGGDAPGKRFFSACMSPLTYKSFAMTI